MEETAGVLLLPGSNLVRPASVCQEHARLTSTQVQCVAGGWTSKVLPPSDCLHVDGKTMHTHARDKAVTWVKTKSALLAFGRYLLSNVPSRDISTCWLPSLSPENYVVCLEASHFTSKRTEV